MTPRLPRDLRRARPGLALAAALVLTASAHAFYLISPLSYWPVSSVAGNVVFNVGLVASPPNVPNPPLLDGSASWNDAFVAQLNAWNAILPDAVLNLSAVTGAVPVPAEGDGTNNVFFSDTIYGDTWGSSTLGICLSFWSGNERTEADVLFNSTKTWNAYTGNLQGNTAEFRRVALHELGHALLLDHPDDVGQVVSAIMNSASSNTDALTTDDKAGVLAVFGGLTPVTITRQLRAITTNNGANASFRIEAAGSEPLSYAWERSTNGGTSWNPFGLDGPAFTFGPFTNAADGNLFRVTVTNPAGSVTSNTVMLIVTGGATTPSFDVAPVAATITEGADVIFAAHAGGSPTPSYQWEVSTNGGGSWSPMFSSFGPTDVTGINSPTLKITNTIAQMNGYQFRAVATNSAGSDTSAAVTLTVNAGGPAPYFTWQPLDVFATTGTTALIPAGVSGSPPPTLQWEISLNGGSTWNNATNGGTFTGATTSTLSITSPDLGQNGAMFRLNATNGSGSATSRAVMLSVRSIDTAPSILDQPDNANASAGQNVTFTSRLHALPSAVFQWEYSPDGVTFAPLTDGLLELGTITLATIVSGANARALTLTGVDESLDQFRFRLIARNEEGSATSSAATLTIGAAGTAPSFTTHPSNTTKLVGENATFTVAATSDPTPTIQWQRSTNGGGAWADLSNDVTFSGVTSNTLTVTAVTVAMSGHQFRAVATNTVSSTNSNAATLTVNEAPAITTQPSGTTKLVGENATFTGAASGTPTPTLQWQRSTNGGGAWNNLSNDATFSGVTTGTLTVTSVTLAMSGHQFRLVATNTVSSVNSNAATLTVNQAPAITTHPSDATVTYTGDPTFTVAASGTPTPTIQWQISTNGGTSWNNVTDNATFSGATTATLTLTNPPVSMNGNRFRAIASSTAGSATSNAAILTVNAASATVTLSNLTRTYTGSPLAPTATTAPVGLSVGFTYNGSGTTPTNVGSYAVVATITDPNYTGSANGTFLINPSLVLSPVGPVNTNAGATTTLGVTASGGGTPTYQWQMQPSGGGAFADLAGATSASYVVPSTQRFHAGTYRVVVTINGIVATSSNVVVNVLAPPANAARLLNLSTRGLAQSGDNVLIPGFVIQGTTNKRLLIRAVGPTLALPPINFGAGVAPDPSMQLRRFDFSTNPPTQIDVANNDDWQTNANAAEIITTSASLGAFALQDPKDAVLLIDLAPGQYTVTAGDKNGTSGIAIVELYDADTSGATARLINISNRGFCGVGANVMIPGFVVSPEGPKTLLIRVVGPTLGGFGVPGTMADPKLTLYRTNPVNGQNTELFTQDNWSAGSDAAFTASTAAAVSAFALPNGSADAAFVVTLEPGVYTVIGSAADGTSTGVIIVEVYVVP